jgi:hypothetical protein
MREFDKKMTRFWQDPSSVAQVQLIARSLKHWTGRDLCAPGEKLLRAGSETGAPLSAAAFAGIPPAEFAEKVFHAPFVLVAHGTEVDPVLNYGNQAALTLWEMSWAEFTSTPSRLTAEAPNREERARLLAEVTAHGFIDNYSGIRVSRTGCRFRILEAMVWNLLDARQNYAGQAARFSRWELL